MLLDIYLQTHWNGQVLLVGHYQALVVPRIGEQVNLVLSSEEKPEGEPHTLHFRVTEVQYTAKNMLTVLPWMVPYPAGDASTFIILEVTPATYNHTAPEYEYITRRGEQFIGDVTTFDTEEEE